MSGFQENLKILRGHKFPSKYLKHSFSLKKHSTQMMMAIDIKLEVFGFVKKYEDDGIEQKVVVGHKGISPCVFVI